MKKPCLFCILLLAGALTGIAQELPPIKIGLLNIRTVWPKTGIAGSQGAELAVRQINEKGGLLGRKLVIVERDVKETPADAIKQAEELVNRDKVDLLVAYVYSNTSLALSDWCKHHKVVYVGTGAADSLTLEHGNRYAFIFETSTYTLAAVTTEAIAQLPGKRAAIIAPNYEYGHAIVKQLQAQLPAKKPGVEWVSIQYPAMGKLQAGATIVTMEAAKPDIIVSAIFSRDHALFVREGKKRGLFENRQVISLLGGWLEELETLGAENPVGWIGCSGYPGDAFRSPASDAFVEAYRRQYNQSPLTGSLWGYMMFQGVAAGIAKAGSVETEKLVDAMKGVTWPSPVGSMSFRALDHHACFGTWVGKIDVVNGKGVLRDPVYKGGDAYLPPPEMVAKLRPKD